MQTHPYNWKIVMKNRYPSNLVLIFNRFGLWFMLRYNPADKRHYIANQDREKPVSKELAGRILDRYFITHH